jgi:CelD/BcsL family acetyltransferase involved in cellulose biosynthesis
MKLYTLNPMVDSRWEDLVASHPRASAFHRQGWLKALAGTYGYRPVVLTSTPPGQPLSDGIVFCEINSWITGSRLVSLPFADHTDPLLSQTGDAIELAEWMRSECRNQKWKYIEFRPQGLGLHSPSPLVASHSYWFHTLDLTPSIEQVFHNLHKNCIQRRIRKAEREKLTYEKGSSDELVEEFYQLMMITRRRHQLLPQPRAWFRNLIACMGANSEIRMARNGNIPIAAMLTLKHQGTVIYKYGCSDEKFHQLAGMPFLFWKLIEESKFAGAEQIDLGRTEMENHGLIRFKDRLGTTRRRMTYYRYPRRMAEAESVSPDLHATRRLFSVLPDALSSRAGQLVYRHIG